MVVRPGHRLIARLCKSLSRPEQRRVQLLLSAGPWFWPDKGTPALERARAVAARPPASEPGAVLVLAVGATEDSIWLAAPGDGRSVGAGLGPESVEAWRNAVAAVPRSLPLLWEGPAGLAARLPHVRRLWCQPRPGQVESDGELLDGASVGLAFAICAASSVLRISAPVDLVASAACGPDGRLAPVEEIERKVRFAIGWIPRLRRVLVHPSNAAAAREAAARAVQVVEVSSAAEAFREVFGKRLSDRLAELGSNDEERRAMVRRFFDMTVCGRGDEVLEWHGLRMAARRARELWTLGDDERRMLVYAEAVAARHDVNEGALDLPEERWMKTLPAPKRLQVIANLLQQSADSSQPAPERVEPYAREQLAATHPGFAAALGTGTPGGRIAAVDTNALRAALFETSAAHARVIGALGRLLAVTGRPRDALALEQESARALFEMSEYESTSRPLCEWYRLAGVLGDGTAFEEAERFRSMVGSYASSGEAYARLARNRAAVTLRLDELSRDAFAQLERLAADGEVPDHVRWSALRWCARESPETGAERFRARLNEGAAGEPRHDLRRAFAALAALDLALKKGDKTAAAAQAAELCRLQPGVCSNLARGVSDTELPMHLAHWFPY